MDVGLGADLKAMKSIESMIQTSMLWKRLGEKRGWIQHFGHPGSDSSEQPTVESGYFRHLHSQILQDIENLENKWDSGEPTTQVIQSDYYIVYCLQHDDTKVVAGLFNGSIRIWDKTTLQCIKEIQIAEEPIRCLQFNDKVIVGGDGQGRVTVVSVTSGEILISRKYHADWINDLRFNSSILVTASEDKSVGVWKMSYGKELRLRKVLTGHQDGVTCVDFDDKYIVSGSWDKTIKVWATQSCQLLSTLRGHRDDISCMEYHDGKVASGDDGGIIRIWNLESCTCTRILTGHRSSIWSIRLDGKRIVSGAENGEIKIWSMKSTKPESESSPTASVFVKTIHGHNSHVTALQLDDFQIVSGSTDGTILIWNFDMGAGAVSPEVKRRPT